MRDFRGYLVAAICVACVVFGVAVGIHLSHRGKPAPKPGPGPTPVVAVKGDHLVVIVDDSNPTIPEGQVLDGPQFDGLRGAGKVAIRKRQSEWVTKHRYEDLVAEAGGCPAVFALTKDGDLAAAPCRLPDKEDLTVALCQKLLNNCPAPLPPAKALAVTNPGEETNTVNDTVFANGHVRYLSAKPDGQKLRALAPKRYADSHPIFPIAQWRPVNRRNVFTWDQYGLDQNGYSSCVAQSNSNALTKVRALAGMKPVKLSPAFLYAHINRGRDQGAIISEGADALVKVGTCPFDMLGQHPFYQHDLTPQMREAAVRYKAGEVYHVDTWEELGSALQTGRYVAVFGAMVGRNFNRFDQHGVCGHDVGPGNHALHADGIELLSDGRWVLDVPNSWGEEWGPWRNGRCYLDRNHLFANGDMPDVCVIRAAADDPKEPWDPPAWTGKKALKAFGPEVALAP
jgi:hypothetical protein